MNEIDWQYRYQGGKNGDSYRSEWNPNCVYGINSSIHVVDCEKNLPLYYNNYDTYVAKNHERPRKNEQNSKKNQKHQFFIVT